LSEILNALRSNYHFVRVKLCFPKLLDDFPDTVGFARIVQALQATEWPCLQMKGKKINVDLFQCSSSHSIHTDFREY
jgi:hypothetical protein